jgi:hypothetical protein
MPPTGLGNFWFGFLFNVAKRRWKLASYEVAGNAPARFIRPERTMDSAVPSGRIRFGSVNQTLRVWLISGCPVGTNGGRGEVRRTGIVVEPAMPTNQAPFRSGIIGNADGRCRPDGAGEFLVWVSTKMSRLRCYASCDLSS